MATLLNSHTLVVASLCALLAASISFFSKYYFASQRPKDFPPGPDATPFLGNLDQLPRTKAFLKFHELGKEYGSIIGLKFGPQNVVVLNSYKHVKALFDKKGSIYSSRPDSYIGNELLCPGNTHILLVPYGHGWRKLRKVCQSLLNVNAVNNILPIQNAEATQTMLQLVQDPNGYYDHIRRYSTAVILASVYGQRGARFDSPKIQALYHAQDQFTSILEPGATPPVDAFPFLKSLPEFMASWKTKAKTIQKEQKTLYFSLLRETRDRMAKGSSPDCFMRLLLEQTQVSQEMDENHVAYLGGILMEAGSDTTASTILSFVLAMIKHPEILKRAQKEVDNICGLSRSPTSDDIESLPFLKACMEETLRWRPVAAGGIPHMLIQDDTYDGYFLPKGTILFANTWAIHRDELEYDQPEDFKPDRYISNKFGTRNLIESGSDDGRRVTYAFGAGRRVCPGQRLAENSLMVNMAKLTWGFDILAESAPVDVDINTAYSDGFLTAPKKFPVTFSPRSEKHREVFTKEAESAETLLARY